jgi:hypothetical protein
MKNIPTFEEFINEVQTENWPFDGKKYLSTKEVEDLYKFIKKNDILSNYDESDYEPATVKYKKLQSNNVEKAWELFEVWASSQTFNDSQMFLAEHTFTSHDFIYDSSKDKVGNLATEIQIEMIRNRSKKDVSILKKMKFII